ncbi:MAG: tetratricopeptide repeat protein [Candidatus Omnitrophota bacterium]
MKRGVAFLSIILLLLLLASAGAAGFFYFTWDEQKNQLKLLESDLEAGKIMLDQAKGSLTQKDQLSSALSEKNKALSDELSTLKKNVSETQLTKGLLEGQVKELSAKEKILEAQIIQVMQSSQEQLSLKEKEIQKQLLSEKETISLEKQALAKQAVSSEVLLKTALARNEQLRAQLEKNKTVLEWLHKDKIGQELLQTKDTLKTKEDRLQEMIKENEKLIAGFKDLELEKSTAQNELALSQDELKKQTAKFHYNLALVFDQGSRYREAEAEYRKALELIPDDADAHYNLGVLYDEALKDNQKAITHYKAYLQLRPEAVDGEQVAHWISKAEERLNWGKLELLKKK